MFDEAPSGVCPLGTCPLCVCSGRGSCWKLVYNYTPVTVNTPHLSVSLGFLQQDDTSLHCHPPLPSHTPTPSIPFPTSEIICHPMFHSLCRYGLILLACFSASPVGPQEEGGCVCSVHSAAHSIIFSSSLGQCPDLQGIRPL